MKLGFNLTKHCFNKVFLNYEFLVILVKDVKPHLKLMRLFLFFFEIMNKINIMKVVRLNYNKHISP